MHGLHYGGFSRCRAQALEHVGFSRRAAGALTCRLSSDSTQAELPRGMWGLPEPGIERVSPALEGRFSTTGPPGKSLVRTFLSSFPAEGLLISPVLLVLADCEEASSPLHLSS